MIFAVELFIWHEASAARMPGFPDEAKFSAPRIAVGIPIVNAAVNKHRSLPLLRLPKRQRVIKRALDHLGLSGAKKHAGQEVSWRSILVDRPIEVMTYRSSPEESGGEPTTKYYDVIRWRRAEVLYRDRNEILKKNAGCADRDGHVPVALAQNLKIDFLKTDIRSQLSFGSVLHMFDSSARGLDGSGRCQRREGSKNSSQQRSNGLSDIPIELAVCQCAGFFRSLRCAPLLAQVSFFAVQGAGAVCYKSTAALLAVFGNKGRPMVITCLFVCGLSCWVFAASDKQMGYCHKHSSCNHRESNAEGYSPSRSVVQPIAI